MSWNQETGEIDLYIHCSSGTYIRSIARDLGEKIGCGGILSRLRRLEALGFNERQAIPLPKYNERNSALHTKVINPILSLKHLYRFQLKGEEDYYWRNGRQIITMNSRIKPPEVIEAGDVNSYKGFLLVLNNDGSIGGIAQWLEDSIIKPKVVFNPF